MKSGINLKNLDEFSPDVIQQDDIKVVPRWFWGLYRLQYFSSYVRVYRLSAEDVCVLLSPTDAYLYYSCGDLPVFP